MAFFDTLGAAQRGAAIGMQNYGEWLRQAGAANQLAANAVQSDIDAANQAARYKAGLLPTSTAGYTPMDLNVGLRTPGGEVEQKSVQYNPVKNGQVALPIYAPASPPPGPTVPAAPAAPAAGLTTPGATPTSEQVGPISNNMSFGRGWLPQPNQLPIEAIDPNAPQFSQNLQAGKNQYRIDKRLSVLGSDVRGYPEIAGTWNYFMGSPQQGEIIDYRAKAGSWIAGPEALKIVQANPELLAEAERDPIAFYKKYGPEGQAATTTTPTATTATTQPGASAGTDTTAAKETAAKETAAAETAATTQTAGLTPPPEGGTGEPVDMSPVSLVTNPQARAKLSDADLDYRNTGLMDNRNLIIQMFNREVGNMRADAARNDQLRVQQYNSLMQQAQAATTAGNTGYAQSLIDKADALLQEASNAVTTQRQAMDTLQSNAQKLLNDNETELLANQAVIAEREFTVGNNPSRMLSMLEAYGFGGVNLEGMPNGKLRIVLPTESGGTTYYADQSGNPAEMTKQDFVNFFMGTLSEDFRAKQIEAQAAQAAEALKFQRELEKISFESYADAQKEIAKGLGEDTYATKINDDGSITYTPKDPNVGLPIILVRPKEGANGMTEYKTQFINVAGVR